MAGVAAPRPSRLAFLREYSATPKRDDDFHLEFLITLFFSCSAPAFLPTMPDTSIDYMPPRRRLLLYLSGSLGRVCTFDRACFSSTLMSPFSRRHEKRGRRCRSADMTMPPPHRIYLVAMIFAPKATPAAYRLSSSPAASWAGRQGDQVSRQSHRTCLLALFSQMNTCLGNF